MTYLFPGEKAIREDQCRILTEAGDPCRIPAHREAYLGGFIVCHRHEQHIVAAIQGAIDSKDGEDLRKALVQYMIYEGDEYLEREVTRRVNRAIFGGWRSA